MNLLILIAAATSTFALATSAQQISSSPVANGQLVSDPVADYSKLAHGPQDKLLKLAVDLNHDGKNVIFLSSTHDYAGKDGNIWNAYIPVGTKYLCITEDDSGDSITFQPDRYFIGRLPGLKGGDMLMTYGPGGAGKGTFYGYQIVDKKVRATIIKTDFEPAGADRKTYDNTLGSHFTRTVQKVDYP